MASLIPEVAYEEMLGGVPEVQGEPQRQRRPRLRLWRGIVLLLAGVYFLIPLYAGLRFSFQNDAGQFSLYAVKAIPSQTGFSAAFFGPAFFNRSTLVAATRFVGQAFRTANVLSRQHPQNGYEPPDSQSDSVGSGRPLTFSVSSMSSSLSPLCTAHLTRDCPPSI